MRQSREGAGGGIAEAAERREQRRQQDMDPLVGFALAHAELPPLDHLNGVGLQVGEPEEQPIFRRCQRAGPINGEATAGSGFSIEPPRRHRVLERGLEGRHQGLKLLQGQTGEIEELRRAGRAVQFSLGDPVR